MANLTNLSAVAFDMGRAGFAPEADSQSRVEVNTDNPVAVSSRHPPRCGSTARRPEAQTPMAARRWTFRSAPTRSRCCPSRRGRSRLRLGPR